MKRRFVNGLIISLLYILLFSMVVNAEEKSNIDFKTIVQEESLEIVDKIPEGIIPIYVDNEEELKTLLIKLERVYLDKGSVQTSEKLLKVPNNPGDMMLQSTQLVNNKILTHSETIFDLSSLGEKIVSDVNYTYSYWVAPEKYETKINYHDVYETGIYGCQEITYFNKSITNNRATISVNVRGNSKVYIGLSGGGAEGNIVLKTFPFDKSYSINVGFN